jgi:hypothetical protein
LSQRRFVVVLGAPPVVSLQISVVVHACHVHHGLPGDVIDEMPPVAVFSHEELDVFLFIVGMVVIRVCYATAKRWTKSEAAVG